MKTIATSLLLLSLIARPSTSWAATEFMNLDFEAGDIQAEPIIHDTDGSTHGPTEKRLPNWQVLVGDADLTQSFLQLNGGGIADSLRLYNSEYRQDMPVEGALAFMAGRPTAAQFSVSLVQRGLVPLDAKSLHFQAYKGSWEVRIDGVNLTTIGWSNSDTSSKFQDVSVDVAPWAGQEVELKLTQAFPSQWNAIDSIRFSAEPVIPEPRVVLIAAVGIVSLVCITSRPGKSRF